MLSESFGHDLARALLPPAARISVKKAQRCWDSVLHCTAVCGAPSFLTFTEAWQNLQSTSASPAVR